MRDGPPLLEKVAAKTVVHTKSESIKPCLAKHILFLVFNYIFFALSEVWKY